ncbi:NAD(P)/FAD-dependent oxidoreductase [Streptomyces fodineus]|uniref:NAD(P)/FAD-dependent oxidoreductase n=1 Tax=Streptomyces fodineus TaxID=1904616 RepID=UPI0009A0BBCC|nr:FAD-dependent oxidoreductase [Streptomyces fodineus]
MTGPHRIAVVGASAAGLTTAKALRSRGYEGTLTLIGDEQHLPYDRPPLSKQILAGTWEPDRTALCGAGELGALGADLLLGRSAVGLDVAGRQVLLDGGDRIGFDGLVIATGVTPRRLPGAGLAGIHVLRTLDDALSLRLHLLGRPTVAVVGAGFLGAEVAAVARGMGLDVTLIDPLPVPMYRQFGARIGELIGQLHTDHGVTVRCGAGVRRFLDTEGRVSGVELTDGSVLVAELVVVAVGARPAIDWLADSGLPHRDGVECDAFCQVIPGIYAAGDVASWHNNHFGTRMRLEHRMNATEQALAVAGNMLGAAREFAPVPYFWTDQYDARIQAYGIFPADADIAVLHGRPADRTFVVGYGHQGKVAGVLGWNSPRELRTLRQLVVDRTPWPPKASLREAAVAELPDQGMPTTTARH